MTTNKILGSKNVLKKAFVFLVLSASFLSLNSQDAFAEVAGDQSKITSKLVKNVKKLTTIDIIKEIFIQMLELILKECSL